MKQIKPKPCVNETYFYHISASDPGGVNRLLERHQEYVGAAFETPWAQ
jgi:hypothetical protein